MIPGMTLLAVQLSILEIIIFQVAALVIGFVISYLWSIRNGGYETKLLENQKRQNEEVSWRLKYYELTEQHQQQLDQLQQQLSRVQEQEQQLSDEVHELRMLNQELMARPAQVEKPAPVVVHQKAPTEDYVLQLQQAQHYLASHNESIQRLLSQIKDFEESQQQFEQVVQEKEELSLQVHKLQRQIQAKDQEIELLNRNAALEQQMKEQLHATYDQFHEMQEKLKRMEAQLHQPAQMFRLEELEEANHVLNREVAQLRAKYREMAEENSRLQSDLTESESKLREALLQQQQMQKRNAFLESFNQDLQQVADQNKQLEEQLQRISQLEGMITKNPSASNYPQ